MDSLTIFGAIGAFIILYAFIMNQTHRWKDTYLVYDLFNFVGSVILVTYAIILKSYPFLILNGVWGLLSLRDIFVDFKRNSHHHTRSFYKKWLN